MLDEISAVASPEYRLHLISKIESVDTNTSIGFEVELAVTWALSKVCTLEPLGTHSFEKYPPDAVSSDLVPGRLSVIDITTVSDDLQGKFARRKPTVRRGPFGISNSPLRNAIRKKNRQFKQVPSSALRMAFIVDGGSQDAANPKAVLGQWNAVSGDEIMREATANAASTDVACLLYWKGEHGTLVMTSTPIRWRWDLIVHCKEPGLDFSKLYQILDIMPPLNAPPQRLRQMHRSGAFMRESQRVRISSGLSRRGGEALEVSMSKALLQQYILDPDNLTSSQRREIEFVRKMIRDQLGQGRSISGVEIESLRPDTDDDRLVLSYSEDAAVAPLRVTDP